jgi:hypothetical protein
VDKFIKGDCDLNRMIGIILSIVFLALTGLACQALTGGGAGNLPFSDDFSTTGWGTGTDADSSVEYANNALQMIVYTQNYFIWSPPPGDSSYQNIHSEVTVINNDTDATTAFGIICNRQGATSNFHFLIMTPAGEYAIARAVEGQSDVFLTNNDQWASSDQIAQNAASYRGAD